nr:hypothetical protein [Rhizobium sp. YK2]
MGVFGMAHAIWQAGATPEIGEIEQRLHGKQHIEDQQRTQQGTMAEQRIFSSGCDIGNIPSARAPPHEAWAKQRAKKGCNGKPEADPPYAQQLQQEGKVEAAKRLVD